MSTHPIIAEDIRGVLSRTQSLWPELKGASVFITGATGFFGIWLLETLLAANREFSLGCRVIALSRNAASFAAKAPHLAHDAAVTWLAGDVRDFAFPSGTVTHVIHAAAEATSNLNASDPQAMFDVCVEGTRRVLALAREKQVARMLFTSSGAVYGRQPPDLSHVPEDFMGAPDSLDSRNAYAEGKRAAEQLCAIACLPPPAGAGLHITIARCFAFVGPHLPLDAHFAIGNFIHDALAGGPIRISGDGTPYRSYLYAADLTEWLVTILFRGQPGRAYNVGSDKAVSIQDLADLVADITASIRPDHDRPTVVVGKQPVREAAASRYVPNCQRTHDELLLAPATPLESAIRRTLLERQPIKASITGA
ncbi:MAG: NAD(P)-dependent oxidoreductase [Planctomycetia bacterium]|nr:NAD(P)-dependent oxidoreductase [Planctomycetia bacterium]